MKAARPRKTLRAAALVAATAAMSAAVGADPPASAQVKALPDKATMALAVAGVEFATGTVAYIADTQTPFVSVPEAGRIGHQGAALLENYHDRMRDIRFAADLLHSSFNVAIVAGTAMGSATGAGAAMAIPTGALASRANDMARDYLIADVQARASATLSRGLDEMTEDQRQTLDALLGASRFDEAAKHFEQSTDVVARMKQKMAGDVQAARLLDATLTSALAQGSVAAIRAAGAAASKAADVEDRLVDHTLGFSKFAAKSLNAAKRLEQSANGLRTDLDKLTGSVTDLARDQKATAAQVQIIQDVLFDQQSPAVRLKMLDQGAKPGLTAAQREHLKAALQVQVRQQEISQAAAQVVNYARDLGTIMQAAGVDSKELSMAIQYGSAASTALNQAFSGNYLAAIASVAGVFGAGSKPDPMALYMRQIMQAFEQVNVKLDNVIKLQVQTLEAIDALSRDVATLKREAHARFDRIDFELARLSALQRNLVWKDIQDCDSAWDAQNGHLIGGAHAGDEHARYDIRLHRFRDLGAVLSYAQSHGDKAYRCSIALDNRFSSFKNPRGLAGNPLTIAAVESEFAKHGALLPEPRPDATPGEAGLEYGLPALAYYKRLLYEPSLSVVRSAWAREAGTRPGWGSIANAYALLTRPAANVHSLTGRIRALNGLAPQQALHSCRGPGLLGRRLQDYLCTNASPYRGAGDDDAAWRQAELLAIERASAFLSDPLIRDQIGELVRYTLFVERPINFAKGADAPGAHTLEEVGGFKRDHHGKRLLTNAMMVVDVSIAQQSMLYGDLGAWFIYSLLWDAKAHAWRQQPQPGVSQPVFETARKLLKENRNNPWMQRNVLMLILKGQEQGCPELMAREQACTLNDLIYGVIYDRLHEVTDAGAYVSLSEAQLAAAQATLVPRFRWAHPPRLVVRDSATTGTRQLMMDLQGVLLPMPSPAEWRSGAFIYPPQLMERLDDREMLASRLAGYAALDQMPQQEQASLLTVLANSQPPDARP